MTKCKAKVKNGVSKTYPFEAVWKGYCISHFEMFRKENKKKEEENENNPNN